MSHTVVAEFRCNPGRRGPFLEMLLAALVDTRAFEGCELIETYTDQDDPDLVVLYEKWRARCDQEAYIGWRIETGMMGMLGEFMDPTAVRFVHLDPAD